jgi:hyperpolarization activated cyclic nucleotide-gated potassium channel 2
VSSVPFFSEADPIFVSAIITKLRFEVFLEGDIIIQEGTIGAEMYFLREGSVEIRTNNDLQSVLSDGSYFGGKYRFLEILDIFLEIFRNS